MTRKPLEVDHFTFLGNCPPAPPPQANINTYISLKAKFWLTGGVARRLDRTWAIVWVGTSCMIPISGY